MVINFSSVLNDISRHFENTVRVVIQSIDPLFSLVYYLRFSDEKNCKFSR